MKRMALFAIVAFPLAAAADPPPSGPPGETAVSAQPDKMLGVGYKLGDGIGLYGADVIVHPVPHLYVDLYGTYVSLSTSTGDSVTGYAIAPAVQVQLHDGGRSTPYLAVGTQYVHLTLLDATGSGNGVFANAGYEWKWQSGLGILLGGGIQYITKVEASNGVMTYTMGGVAAPNLEFGVRYMFL
jgi:hypothetical protein